LTSQKTFEIVHQARDALAEFFNAADAAEIIFGQNMTSLTFALSRVLAKNWESGAEVIVTSLDHDANVSPWRLAAQEKNMVVRIWQFRKETCSLHVEDLRSLISDRTVLIAVTLASNAVGSLVDVRSVVELVKKVGGRVFVDGSFAAHAKIGCLRLRFPPAPPGSFSVLISASSGRGERWRRQRIPPSVRHQINRPGNGNWHPEF
jgi:selenocysteine lyase/cysteine desulfurase